MPPCRNSSYWDGVQCRHPHAGSQSIHQQKPRQYLDIGLLIENFGGMKACHCYPSADFPTQDYSLPSGRISEPANSPAAATTCPLHRTAFRMVGRSRLIVDRPSHEILRRLIPSLGSLRIGGICADSSSASVTLLFSQQGTFRKFPLKSSFWALFCLLDATEIRE